MASSTEPDIRVREVRLDADTLKVNLMDGRAISVPLAWFPRLALATAAERDNWRIAGAGYGIHWPDLDEDLSTAGLLRTKAREHPESEPSPATA